VKSNAVLQGLEFDTSDSGSNFVNLSDSGELARNPLEWFELLWLTELDKQGSEFPSLNPIDIS